MTSDTTDSRDSGRSVANGIPPKSHAPRMFDRIAPRYDLLNRLLSMRRDIVWRRRLAAMIHDGDRLQVLDVATGTADVILTILKRRANVADGIGLDMAGQMLLLGQKKATADGFRDRLGFVHGDALSLPFASESFDAVTIAFGIRNVVDVPLALREMQRVLKPGGKALILEFSLPTNRLLRAGYLMYFRHVLPRLGSIISGDGSAYRYLNETVEDFPYGSAFCRVMDEAGFEEVRVELLTFGIASIYSGLRK